jgi:hypothetical protein
VDNLEPTSPETADRRWVTRLAGAYLVILYLAACAIIAVFGFVRRQQIPGVQSYFPSPVPTPTPTPHILVQLPSKNTRVLVDNFDTNQYNWSAFYWFSKVEVTNGKLLLRANQNDSMGLAYIGDQTLVIPNGKYYLQADLATDVRTARSYGLVFSLEPETEAFYLFEVIPQEGGYRLFRHATGGWVELVTFKQGNFKPYPESNTLSVDFDHGKIALYANGIPVATYVDPNPINFGTFGVYVDDAGFTLVADNFFAYTDQ